MICITLQKTIFTLIATTILAQIIIQKKKRCGLSDYGG